MIGGLGLNTMLTLLLVPVFYTFFDDMKNVWKWGIRLVMGKSEKKEDLQPAVTSSSIE
jgi:hypothetical protein